MNKPAQPKTMTFLPLKKPCAFVGQPSILEVAQANGIPLNHSCGGMGSCTTCLVHVRHGLESLPDRNELEKEHEEMRGLEPHERLSCQTPAQDGLIVEIPEPS